MYINNSELFESFDYVDNQNLQTVLELTNQMKSEEFQGFKGTSFGTNMKDALSFCIIYSFLENKIPINNLILAMTSYQEDFFQNCLVHLENMSCIKTKNLLPYFAVSANNFCQENLKDKHDFESIKIKDLLTDFVSGYQNFLMFNFDTQSSKYIDNFIEIEKRILYGKLEKKLTPKLYEFKKRKI